MSDIVIINGLRTPYCRAGGAFRNMPAYELGKIALRELLESLELPPESIDQVIWGNASQPPEAANIARVIALRSGIPQSAPAFTVQQNCGSGLQAIAAAFYEIFSGNASAVIAGGVESVSNYPVLYPPVFAEWLRRYRGAKSRAARINLMRKLKFSYLKPLIGLQLALSEYMSGMSMAQGADFLAKEYRISRREQDEYALLSHKRAARASAAGELKEEIAPVFVPPGYDQVVEEDDGIRKEQSAEELAALPPLYDPHYGTVTAGNTCRVSDGAAALLLMSADRARQLGYEPLAAIRSFAFSAVDPAYTGIAPAHASARALQQAKMKFSDIRLTELNEDAAAMVLANERLFADKKFVAQNFGQADILSPIDREKLNVNGGAIALGHPLGSSAARLVITLIKEMKRRNLETGLATMCIGGGQGGAIILERK